LRLSWNWYSFHFARIHWSGIVSEPFVIYNGVRQDGILSPFLFAVHIDELSLCLQSENTGCRLSRLIINHLLFADDAVVFAPSAKGLQRLLDICSKFAVTHNVVFNVTKSQCMIINSKFDSIHHPLFTLMDPSCHILRNINT